MTGTQLPTELLHSHVMLYAYSLRCPDTHSIVIHFIYSCLLFKSRFVIRKPFLSSAGTAVYAWQFSECIRGRFHKFHCRFIEFMPMPPDSTCSSNGSDSYSRKCFPASPVSFSVHDEYPSHEFMLMEMKHTSE